VFKLKVKKGRLLINEINTTGCLHKVCGFENQKYLILLWF